GGGSCNGACAAGFSDCNGSKQLDGCEINTTNDINNCGTCGNGCPTPVNVASRTCSGSVCTIATCNAGFYTLNGNQGAGFNDGCECNAGAQANQSCAAPTSL